MTVIGEECTPPKGITVREASRHKLAVDPSLISATTIIGDKVKGKDGKELGKIEEIMLDLTTSTLAYLVLSSGGVMGIGDKFFALPLDQLSYDPVERTFYLEIDKKSLKSHSGFDKEEWPRRAIWPPDGNRG